MAVPLEHSTLGCSGWAKFTRCVGAPNAEAELPDDAGFEAAQGTVFHELVSDCLQLGLPPESFLGGRMIEKDFEIQIDQEMIDSSYEGLDFLEQLAAEPGSKLYVEHRVDISPWCGKGQFGTTDAAIVNVQERWIIVFDWKYGMEPVYADENDQCSGYALGFWNSVASELFDGDAAGVKVTLVIEQPRVPGAGGFWETTMLRLLEYGEFVRKQATRTMAPDAPRTPGPIQCRWCRARMACDAYAAHMLELAQIGFDEIDEGVDDGLPPILPKEMTAERRGYILEHRGMFERWLTELHATAYNDATHGRLTPGQKLVEGQHPPRKWFQQSSLKAASELHQHLPRDKVHVRALISPTQAEKAVGKVIYAERLKRFVDRGEAKPVLVKIADGRPEIESYLDKFDDERD